MARTNHRHFFGLPISEVYSLFESWINLTHLWTGALTHHLILMSNHFHWILTTPDGNLDVVMCHFLTNISKEVNAIFERKGHLWGGPYKYSLLDEPHKYFTVVKYLYRNAPRAKLCLNVEDYPYSTLGTLYGTHRSDVVIYPECNKDMRIPVTFDFLDWLNTPFQKEENEQIHLSLKRKVFKFRRVTRSRRFEIILPDNIYSDG